IGEQRVALGAMDFTFLGGSMGSVVGEKLSRMIEKATEKRLPVIIISTSGGARMYEGMFSLMQMAKTCAALAYHAKAKLPFISILTDPTYAGVMASYASVGDLIVAEPGAMIGFAGPRVIEATTQSDLPPGFQTAEFLMDHGCFFVDPTLLRARFDHRIFGAHRIGGERITEFLSRTINQIEIRERGLHHRNIRAFGNVQGRLAHRFVRVAGVHLIRAAIAK